MQQHSGSEIILDYLIREGVPYLFGIVGHGNVGLVNALADRRDHVRFVRVHNEQTAGFMADGFYRVSGQPVGTLTSCGPGSVNIQMAIANALFDSSAILAITANVPTEQFAHDAFQELNQHYQADIVTSMQPYVKRSFQATRVEQLPFMIREAYRTMLAGRTGPVHLDVPFNLFLEEAACEIPDPAEWRSGNSGRSAGDPDSVQRAIDLLLSAERPLILAGHGVMLSGASHELTLLAERLGIPVATSLMGKGAIDETHPLSLGTTGRNGAFAANESSRTCDVVLGLGTRFSDRATSGWMPGMTHSIPPTKLVQVDIDPAQLGRNYPPTVAIAGDIRLVLKQMLALLGDRADRVSTSRQAWVNRAQELRREWELDIAAPRATEAVPIRPERVLDELNRVAPHDAIVMADVGAHQNWFIQQWQATSERLFLQSGGFCAMGFGVSGALGAQLAARDRAVIAVCGDGGFMMHANAVATAVEYELPAIWLVWNNGGHVSIRDTQLGWFGAGREYGTRFRRDTTGDLVAIDFAGMGRAMGANGLTVERPQDFGEQLREAVASRQPTVLDVRIDSEIRPLATGSWELPPLRGPLPTYGWEQPTTRS